MNIEKLKERLKEIEGHIAQTLANYNALVGAKNECENWIKNSEEQSVKVEAA